MAWGDPLKSISMTSRIPLNKFAEVENVIDAIIFLLSTDMVNGITLPVDGYNFKLYIEIKLKFILF